MAASTKRTSKCFPQDVLLFKDRMTWTNPVQRLGSSLIYAASVVGVYETYSEMADCGLTPAAAVRVTGQACSFFSFPLVGIHKKKRKPAAKQNEQKLDYVHDT